MESLIKKVFRHLNSELITDLYNNPGLLLYYASEMMATGLAEIETPTGTYSVKDVYRPGESDITYVTINERTTIHNIINRSKSHHAYLLPAHSRFLWWLEDKHTQYAAADKAVEIGKELFSFTGPTYYLTEFDKNEVQDQKLKNFQLRHGIPASSCCVENLNNGLMADGEVLIPFAEANLFPFKGALSFADDGSLYGIHSASALQQQRANLVIGTSGLITKKSTAADLKLIASHLSESIHTYSMLSMFYGSDPDQPLLYSFQISPNSSLSSVYAVNHLISEHFSARSFETYLLEMQRSSGIVMGRNGIPKHLIPGEGFNRMYHFAALCPPISNPESVY